MTFTETLGDQCEGSTLMGLLMLEMTEVALATAAKSMQDMKTRISDDWEGRGVGDGRSGVEAKNPRVL